MLNSLQMLNMVAAGHETTASSLQWATHALTIFPDMQDRLRAEILGMLDETPEPGYTEIESLRYLNNFCREVLRAYCPGKGLCQPTSLRPSFHGLSSLTHLPQRYPPPVKPLKMS
jgi:cytochrome P450